MAAAADFDFGTWQSSATKISKMQRWNAMHFDGFPFGRNIGTARESVHPIPLSTVMG
jgi:hypothetical protein